MPAAGLYFISPAAQVDMCASEVGASQSNMYRDLGEAVVQLPARNLAARAKAYAFRCGSVRDLPCPFSQN